ncbi:MAG: hypothetical protein L6Q55_00145 [Azonexus sp.]|nr:hypothetical protein [Azonexus sp.]MCK6410819.1 hypothetical protein [Azonexus sp.]
MSMRSIRVWNEVSGTNGQADTYNVREGVQVESRNKKTLAIHTGFAFPCLPRESHGKAKLRKTTVDRGFSRYLS